MKSLLTALCLLLATAPAFASLNNSECQDGFNQLKLAQSEFADALHKYATCSQDNKDDCSSKLVALLLARKNFEDVLARSSVEVLVACR